MCYEDAGDLVSIETTKEVQNPILRFCAEGHALTLTLKATEVHSDCIVISPSAIRAQQPQVSLSVYTGRCIYLHTYLSANVLC